MKAAKRRASTSGASRLVPPPPPLLQTLCPAIAEFTRPARSAYDSSLRGRALVIDNGSYECRVGCASCS